MKIYGKGTILPQSSEGVEVLSYIWTEDHVEYCCNNQYILLPVFVLLWYLIIFLYAGHF